MTASNDLAFIDQQKSYIVEMTFSPYAWDRATHSPREWSITDFPPSPRSIIPDEPGVYAFIVEPDMFSLAPANGLLYIGKATSLRSRISEYINTIGKDFNKAPRAHTWVMINRWNGHLKYYYTTTSTVEEAESLEDEMIMAFTPKYNKAVDAETGRTKRAF